MFSLISSVMANPTKSLMSDHLHADHVQRLLSSVEAHPLAIAGKLSLNDLCLLAIRQSNTYQPHRLLRSSASGSGNACYANAQCRLAFLADALRQGLRYFFADGTVLFDH